MLTLDFSRTAIKDAALHAHTIQVSNPLQRFPEFLNRLSEIQYKCSGGTHLRKWGVGVGWGSTAVDFEGGSHHLGPVRAPSHFQR